MWSSVFTPPTLVPVASSLLLLSSLSTVHVQALKSRDNAVIPGYTDEGCYTEATSERALSGHTYVNGGMTVELCAATCAGYTYFGVEYGQECYCGDSLNSGSVPAPPSDCNFHCPGNTTEFCGAGGRLNVYSNNTSAQPTQLITTYNALGCFTETNGGRALSSLSTAADSMTVETCGAFCEGYTYFGVEYGRECYCGYFVNTGSNQVDTSRCNFPCAGSSSETCGGSLLLNVFQYSIGTSTSSTASTSSSTLSTASSVTSSASASLTTSTSPSATSAASSTSSQDMTSTNSNSIAQSSSTQFSSTQSSSTQSTATQFSSTQSTTAQPSSTSSKATPTGPVHVPSVGTCAWIGCYTEATNSRALNSLTIVNYNLMSPEICAGECAGYDMFGVEYGGECYCGNKLQGGSDLADLSNCNMLCDGTPNEYCGGRSVLDVYSCVSNSASGSNTVSGTATSTSPYVAPILTTAPTCNGDNCLNELKDHRFSAEASAFCSTYTTTINNDPAAIPTDLGNCDRSPSAVSSACTCLLWTPPATTSSASSTSFSASVSSIISSTSSTPSSAAVSSTSSSTSPTLSSPASTSVTSQSSSLASVSMSSLSTSTSSSNTPAYTALYVNPSAGSGPTKRQTYNTPILLGGGGLSEGCSGADKYYIQDGKLYDNGLIVAAAPGASNSLFDGSAYPGSIQGTFSVVNGVLQWSNPGFKTTTASFCVYIGDIVIAIFDGQIPEGCVPVQIVASDYDALCDGNTASTTFQPVTWPSASSTSSSSVPTSTPIETCSTGADPETDTTVVPAADPNIISGDIRNLSPSNYATLYYAEPAPGTTVLEVEYAMTYPQVTLENYNLIDVLCNGNVITITATTSGAFSIISSWPQTNLVLITNSATCNSAIQRGVYMVTSYSVDTASLTATLNVISQTWTDVAETMEVFYGTGVISGSSTKISYTPSCTATLPTSTSTSTGVLTYADLTPLEKEVLAYLMQNITFDANGNMANTVPPQSGIVVPTPDFDPTPNATQEAATEDAFKAAGLPSPNDLHNQTGTSLAGYCSNGVYIPPSITYSKRDIFGAMSNAPSLSPAVTPQRAPRRIHKRDDEDDESWWEYLFEFVCGVSDANSVVEDFTKEAEETAEEDTPGIGEIIDLICTMKDIFDTAKEAYDNRNAMHCFLLTCWVDLPPTEYWNFTYDWTASFKVPPQTLVTSSVGSVSVVDASLTVSEVQFEGSVVIVLSSTPELKSASMTPTISWSANLLWGLTTTSAWYGNYNYNFATLSFPTPIVVPGEFSITPTISYGIGLSWVTDSKVSFTGGGTVSVNQGSMLIDFMAETATDLQNWAPTVDLTYPIFTSAATASFNPIMRSSISIQVSIFNVPYGPQPIYITDATSIGFNAALIESDGGACPAGELMMTSYSSVANNVVFGSGATPQLLAPSGDVAGTTKCFAVPNDIPTNDEIAELKLVGAAYCTSYENYVPRTVVAYAASTTTTPATTQVTSSTTISTKSTSWIYTTITTTYYNTKTVPTPVYVYTSGSQSLPSADMKRRGLETPHATTMHTATRPNSNYATKTPAPAERPLDPRAAVPTPTLISTWDSSRISLACKQVATGTATTTFFTSTKTVYSGTVTSTSWSTIDVLGQIVTSTSTLYEVTDGEITVTSGGPATQTVATSCPLQTQVSCFKIKAQGGPSQSNVNGKSLYYVGGWANELMFGGLGSGWIEGIWYLTCEGYLVSLPGFYTIVQEQWGSGVVQPMDFADATREGIQQVCTKDTVAGTLSCGAGWYTSPPVGSTDDEDADTIAYYPFWADGGNQFGVKILPIALIYEDVPCPCSY